jgi:hypothetical protein
MTALSRYEDDRVQIGGQKAMEECTRMPTPSDIISRMPNVIDEQAPYILEQGRKCGLCGYIGMCIQEEPFSDTWRCRQCYTGLTAAQHAARMKHLIGIMGKNKGE